MSDPHFQPFLQEFYRLDPARRIWQPKGRDVHHDYVDADGLEITVRDIITGCADRSVASPEIHAQATGFPAAYHLSAERTHLLRPLADLIQGKNVLEIGSGCGVITRWLGEAAASVTALEGSAARAEITALRCADLHNVDVVADQLAGFQTTQKFDIVTLIGVLEYAGRFDDASADPAMAMLERARSLLAPGGRLILAIENQLGLKYFCGAPEDHYGQPMYGINDAYTPRSMRTYGRATLQAMLQQAGFTTQELAAALPDYKFTSTIIVPENLRNDADRHCAAQLAASGITRDTQLERYPLIAAPELAIQPVIENGLLADMTNSFLIVARANEKAQPAFDAATFAHYIARGRQPHRTKSLAFTHVAGGTISVSGAPYHAGQLWSLELARITSRTGWTMNQLGHWFNQWVAAIVQHAGLPVTNDPNQPLDGSWLDATPFNMVMATDGTATFFDLEWTSEAPLTLGRLAFRSLLLCLTKLSGIAQPSDGVPVHLLPLICATLKAGDLAVDDDDIDHYLQLESTLHSQATGHSQTITAQGLAAQQIRFFATGASFITIQNLYLKAADEQERLSALYAKAVEGVITTGLPKSVADYEGEIHRLHREVEILQEAAARDTQELQREREQQAERNKGWAKALDMAERDVAASKTDLFREHGQAKATQQALVELQAQHEKLATEMAATLQTLSWRITRPLRTVRRLFRK